MPSSCRNQSTDFYAMETRVVKRLNYLMTQLRPRKGKSKIKIVNNFMYY